MKRIVVLSVLLVMMSATVEAQKDYIAPFFSYGFGLGKTDMVIQDEKVSWSSTESTTSYAISNQGFSMGWGIKAGLLYGHQLSEHVGLEFAAEYFRSAKNVTNEQYYEEYSPIPTYNMCLESKNTYFMQAISLTPMIKMSAGYTYWNPYVKCGVIMSLQLLKKEYHGELANRFPGYIPYETLDQVNRFSPRFNVGGIGVFGLNG